MLVNNAGTGAFMPTTGQDPASFEAMFDVNVRGTFFLTAALAPKIAARGGGSIVNITTMATQFGHLHSDPGFSHLHHAPESVSARFERGTADCVRLDAF